MRAARYWGACGGREPGDGFRDEIDDLIDVHDAEIVIRQQRQHAASLRWSAIQHNRARLRDAERAAGQHAAACVDLGVAQSFVKHHFHVGRQPIVRHIDRRKQTTHAARGTRFCNGAGEGLRRNEAYRRFILTHALDEAFDDLIARRISLRPIRA